MYVYAIDNTEHALDAPELSKFIIETRMFVVRSYLVYVGKMLQRVKGKDPSLLHEASKVQVLGVPASFGNWIPSYALEV